MDFLIDVFWALAMVGVPVAVFTLAIVWWALGQGHFKELVNSKALEQEIKAFSKSQKKDKSDKENKTKKPKEKQHPILEKWTKFGGGFYGIVALFTYLVIEIREIITMVVEFGGFIDFLKELDIGLIIRIFIDAIMNFVSAIAWPWYWMQRIDAQYIWVWFIAAYLGYRTGLRVAQLVIQRRSRATS